VPERESISKISFLPLSRQEKEIMTGRSSDLREKED
jgi:hypothetical protein